MKRSRQLNANQEAEFEKLASDVELWRERRPHARAPFPLEILQRVYALAEQSTGLKVYRRLGMNHQDVAGRIKVAARGKKKIMKRRAKQIKDEFIELPMPLTSRAPIIITVDRGEGIRFVLEISKDRLGEAAALVANFVGGIA